MTEPPVDDPTGKGTTAPVVQGPIEFVVLTGMSGSGKSTALRALEDSGFYCIDNLPADLLPDVARLAETSQHLRRIALAMDVRHSSLSSTDLVERLQAFGAASGTPVNIAFLTATDDKVIARFSETRRRHPLMTTGEASNLRQALSQERLWLDGLRHMAQWIIDTTELTVHDLKRVVQERFGEPGDRATSVTIMSFGFRYGPPREADFTFDVRYLANPYFVETLRAKTGADPDVANYVMSQPAAQAVLKHITALLTDVLPLCHREGRATVTVGIGCTGGQHRSVAMACAVADVLRQRGTSLSVRHREQDGS